MKEYVGVISELGASNSISNGHGSNGLTTYSYVQIGDQIIKKVKAFTGIRSKLEAALQQDKSATLYLHGKYLIGVKMADGKLFATDGSFYRTNIFLFGLLVTTSFSFLLIFPIFFFLIGIPALGFAAFQWRHIAAMRAARAMPNSILI